MYEDLEGKLAIVTGAGRGIGEAIARTHARNGAKVVVADIGVTALAHNVDVSITGGSLRVDGGISGWIFRPEGPSGGRSSGPDTWSSPRGHKH